MVEFGIQIEPQFGFSYQKIKELALECEAAGFNSMWLSDHFFMGPHSVDQDCLECWTTLSALAVDTSRLRLGTMATCVSYRYPAILAKIAASVDVISGGRVEFGIGAGWKEEEYNAYGIPFPSPGERVGMLTEAVQIIQALWTQERATFEGKYYQVKDAVSSPKPVQKPYPTFWIGGSKPRLLRMAARFADGVNLGGAPSIEQYKERLNILEEQCGAIDRDYGAIKKSNMLRVIVAEDESKVQDILNEPSPVTGLAIGERRLPGDCIGTPEQVVDYLGQFIELGVTQFMCQFPYRHESRSIDLMAQRVLPAFR